MTAAEDFDDAVHEAPDADVPQGTDAPGQVEPTTDAPDLLEDWDFTFVAPEPTSPPLLEAVRLAMGVLKLVKVTAWADLPTDTWRLLEERDVRLSEAQVALLDEYDALLGFVRQSVAKRGDNPGAPGLRLAVCPECAKQNVPSWKLMVSGSAGTCAVDSSHTGAMLSPTAVKTTVAARKAAAKKAAETKADTVSGGADDGEAPAPGRQVGPDASGQEELDFG